MTKTAAKKHRKRRQKSEKAAARRSNDRGVLGAMLLVVGFILVLWFFIANESFPHAIIGAAVAVLGWINYVAFRIYLGSKVADWQRPLAKIPLQFAGYGSEEGKPLEAAKGQSNARNAILIFLLASVLFIVALAVFLVR